MALLSAHDEQTLTQHLATIDTPVTLLLFTQAIDGSETGPVAKQILTEVARLNDKITVEEKSFVLDLEERSKYGVDKAPAIVILRDGQDTRMRMYGAPTGYEFVGLIEAVHMAGSGKVDLAPTTLALVAKVDTPTNIQVFSTPT
jgi:alkyl hydroperoxide reductase subunit AhpF